MRGPVTARVSPHHRHRLGKDPPMSDQNEPRADKLSAEGLAAAAQEDVQQSVSDLQAQAAEAAQAAQALSLIHI